MTCRAVMFGINEYPGMPLKGCVNDVRGMATDLVVAFDYSVRNIRLACDNRATAHGIISRIQAMRDQTRSGDVGIVHFSGHGTQVATRHNEEVDGYDEVWCPVDFDWDHEKSWILDDTLVEAITPSWAGAHMIVVSDSCHSGDMIDAGNDRDIPLVRNRYWPPPVDMEWRARAAKLPVTKLLKGLSVIPGIACLSGCQSTQTSSDAYIQGENQGAFTWALRYWLRTEPDLSIRDIIACCAKTLADAHYDQIPTCSGDAKILDAPWPR